MALTLLGSPEQRVEFENDRATLFYHYTSDSDIPNVGDTVSEVDAPGTWYCSDVVKINKRIDQIQVTARIPGRIWTAYGLAPIQVPGSYKLGPNISVDPGGDGTSYDYSNWWSNWDSGDDWGLDETEALLEGLISWDIEWVDATQRYDMLDHKNGTLPTGFSLPKSGTAGAYLCRAVECIYEPIRDHDTGAVTARYRCFGTFWEAPVVDSTQMTWRHSAW